MRQMQRQVPGQDWDLEWLREELGVGRRGGCADGGGTERGGGGMRGCVWGSRGTVRVQAEVVVLLRQG